MACEGWWEQDGFGRQAMLELQIEFDDGRLRGAGVDIIGPFTLHGSIDEDGAASILKRYVGQHDVVYLGQYDGEGVISGQWDIDGYRGEWMIRLNRRLAGESEIHEFHPQPPNH